MNYQRAQCIEIISLALTVSPVRVDTQKTRHASQTVISKKNAPGGSAKPPGA